MPTLRGLSFGFVGVAVALTQGSHPHANQAGEQGRGGNGGACDVVKVLSNSMVVRLEAAESNTICEDNFVEGSIREEIHKGEFFIGNLT
jgi:hypothetical protein